LSKGQTQGIRTDFGKVAIVRGFRRRKGIGKALDDRVLGNSRPQAECSPSSEQRARRLAET